MATISGSYRETNIVTIAALITLMDAHLVAENARMVALGGAATSIIGTITINVKANNGSGQSYIHKITSSINSPTLADSQTLLAALSIFATAVETESAFTTVVEVEGVMSLTLVNPA